MRPHQLKALIAAADHGSIRAAARSVFLSQAALTKALRELEEELDIALVNRTTHGVQLTDAGRLVYARASAIVAQMRAARDEVERLKGGASGTLRAAISPLPALTILPAAYQAFRRRMPDVDLHLIEGNLEMSLPRLREGALDFVAAGTVESHDSSEFNHTDLCTDDIAVLCRRGHPAERATTIEEILPFDWIQYSANTDFAARHEESMLASGAPLTKRTVKCSSVTLTVSLLSSTDAIAFLPRGIVEPAWVDSLFTCVPVPFVLPLLHVRIFTRRHSPLSAPAQLMIDCLSDAARRGAQRGARKVSPGVRNVTTA